MSDLINLEDSTTATPVLEEPTLKNTARLSKDAKAGGLWKGSLEEDDLDWKGEDPKDPKPIGKSTILPVSRTAEKKTLIKSANITDDHLRAITDEVTQRVIQSAGGQGTNLAQAIESALTMQLAEIKRWVEQVQNVAVQNIKDEIRKSCDDTLTSARSEIHATLRQENTDLTAVQTQVTELTRFVQNENRVQLEVVKEATALLKERREWSDADSVTSEQVNAKDREIQKLTDRLAELEKIAALTAEPVTPRPAVPTLVSQPTKSGLSRKRGF